VTVLKPRVDPLEREVAQLQRALAALAQREPERALALLGSLDAKARGSELAVDRTVVEARALSMLARYDEALLRFEELSRGELTPGLILLWADALMHKGNCRAARQVLSELVGQTLSPDEESARARLQLRCAGRAAPPRGPR
jgi:hypothetical protein